MDTDKLRYFVMIAETGSLTKAAQIIGISHSGLSKAISALEAESNVKLFRPLGRGLEITPEGKWFYQKAQEILKIADEIYQAKELERLPVRIGISGAIVITCAGHLAEELKQPMQLVEIDVGEVEAKIIGGEIDFGIAFIPSPKPELEYLEIGEVRFGSYARADFLKTNDSANLPFVVPASDYAFNPLGYKNRDGWPKDIPRNPRFAVSGFAVALDLLRAGQAGVYMPEFVAQLENDRSGSEMIVAVPEHKKAQTLRKLFLVKRQIVEESAEMKKVAKVMRRICCVKARSNSKV